MQSVKVQSAESSVLSDDKNGANGQNRTDDPRFTKALLYRLSYVGAARILSLYARVCQERPIWASNIPGLIQENEVRLGSGIFVAGNRGSAALESGPSPRGLLGNPRQTEISGV